MSDPIKALDYTGQTVEYNGVVFGDAASLLPPEFRLVGTPEYDQAGREVVLIRYALDVNAFLYVAEPEEASATVADLKHRLSQPGRPLKLAGLGLGFDDGIVDVAFGPKPRRIETAEVAGQRAFEVRWSVEFAVVPCPREQVGPTDARFLAWNFQTSWSYGPEGDATRTISGYVQWPQIHPATSDAKTSFKTADQYREAIQVEVPRGFARVRRSINENAAKDRLDYAIVDQELPGAAPPPGIVWPMQGRFRLASAGAGPEGENKALSFTTGPHHLASLSVSITTLPNVPQVQGFFVFLREVFKRTAYLRKARSPEGGALAVPTAIEIDHVLNSRTTNYSVAWHVLGCWGSVVSAARIWEPVGGDYDQWRASMAEAWSPRGYSNLKSLAADDYVVNFCDGRTTAPHGRSDSEEPKSPALDNWRWACDLKPEESWLAASVRIRILRDQEVEVRRRAAEWDHDTASAQAQGNPADPTAIPGPAASSNDDTEHVLETRGLPLTYVLFEYKALRAGHRIPRAALTTIGGKPAKEVFREDESEHVAGALLNCTVYAKRQAVIYVVMGQIKKADTLDAGVFGCDGKTLDYKPPTEV